MNQNSPIDGRPTQDQLKMKQVAAGHMRNLLVQMKNVMAAVSVKRKAKFTGDYDFANVLNFKICEHAFDKRLA